MPAWSFHREFRGGLQKGATASLDPDGIINRGWARSLSRFSGKDGIVEYAINAKGKGSDNLPMSKTERRFIHDTFEWLDRLTGLSFVQASSGSTAVIRVNSARRLGGSDGLAVRRKGRFDLYWRDQKGWTLTRYEQLVINHEIGHALGLDHPDGRGANPRYDTKDTVMSYNWRGNTEFTTTDVQALQQLWGV